MSRWFHNQHQVAGLGSVALGLLLVMWLPGSLWAFTTVSLNETFTWSIPGIADGQILFVNRIGNTTDEEVYYAAPLRAETPQSMSVAVTPTQWIYDPSLPHKDLCIKQANLSVWIPSFANYTYALSSWAAATWPSAPGLMSIIHGDYYTHDSIYQMLRVNFNALWMPNPTNAVQIGRIKNINIFVFPLADLYGYEGVEDVPWLKGWPDYSLFQPGKRKKPKGCGLCSRMGLPTFRVNTTVLNPVIEDTDYAYAGLGPEVILRRVYNADPSTRGIFGRCWSFPYETHIDSYAQGALVTMADGRELNFALNTNAMTYTAPAGVLDLLSWTTNLPGKPGWGEFQLEDRATHEIARYEARWGTGGKGQPPITNGVVLAAVMDLNSNAVTLGYANGRPVTIQDAAGRVTTLKYNADGYCTNVVVPAGGTVRFQYDSAGNLQQSTDLIGNLTAYTYSPTGSLTSMNTGGRLWQFQYMSASLVSAVIDPLNHTNLYRLQEAKVSNRWVIASDAAGRATYFWSKNGQSWKDQNVLGYTTLRSFQNGMLVAVTNARGYSRQMAYDARRNLARVTDEVGASTRYTYTALDKVATVTNALGQSWRYTYDSRGNLTEVRQPSGRRTVMTYNARGQRQTVTDPATNTHVFAYDAFGNVIQVTDPLGHIRRFGYDAAGIELTNAVNARGYASQAAFDANRRLTRNTWPDGAVSRYYYDCCAPSASTDERGYTQSVERDAVLKVTARIDALGFRTVYTYDANNNLVRVIDALGVPTVYTYDGIDRLASASNALGRVVRLEYDALNLTRVWPRYATFYGFTYDAANRLLSQADPASRAIWFHRDLLGRVTNTVNARGQRTDLRYDVDGRLTSVTNDGTRLAEFTYDPAGDLAGMVTGQGTTTWRRDKRRMVTQIAYPGGRTAALTYDANGNVATLTYPDSTVVTYAYDRRDRVTNMTWAGQSIAFVYDAAGNLVAENRSNSTISQYAYDGNGRLSDLVHWQGTNVLVSLSLQRDAMGHVVNTSHNGGYLPQRPVLAAGASAGLYNNMEQATAWAGSPCAYDLDGNLTNRSGTRALAAAYDAQGRLMACLRGSTNLACQYDGLGRRTQAVAGGVTRKFYHDHMGRLLFETDLVGGLNAQYVYRDGLLVALWAKNKGWHFYHFNELGSTLALSDSQGKISGLYRYLPSGLPANSYARVPNPFTFVGRYGVVDDGDGLYLMGARHYDAHMGRFLQRDPRGFKGGWNMYVYASANPINYVDPRGKADQGADEYWEAEEVRGAAAEQNARTQPPRPLTPQEEARLKELEQKRSDWYGGPPSTRHRNMTREEWEELGRLETVPDNGYRNYYDVCNTQWDIPENAKNEISSGDINRIPSVAELIDQGVISPDGGYLVQSPEEP